MLQMQSKIEASINAELMDLVHDRASIIVEEEDRISNLPDDIIHRILSFFDMKYAVQTSTLSKKWKHIWTSMPHLNLNTQNFGTLPQFAKFVKDALSHRNHDTDVSTVKLSFTGASTVDMKSIVKYAYLHNVRQLNMIWNTYSKIHYEFPQCFFSSHTLKHLTLESNRGYRSHCGRCVPTSAWGFPALETLSLNHMQLGDDGDKSLNLFSKCVNLKDLTLHHCVMSSVAIFNVCAPQLSKLTITDPDSFPKVFNVVAPQLENLTAVVNSTYNFLQLSTVALDSLEKVNLSSLSRSIYNNKIYVPQLLDLFRKLCSAKFLILDTRIIQVLSSCLNQVSLEPCPFNNLKCLKQNDCTPQLRMPTQLRNYFLESSPNVTFILDLPQVAHKRSRQEEVNKETMAKKVAKLEEENKMQNKVIAQQKATLEAMKLQHEKLMSQMINWKMAELRVQVSRGNPDYELIRSIKSIMELTPESLRVAMVAQLSCQYEEMKHMFLTHIDASQWVKIETELGMYYKAF